MKKTKLIGIFALLMALLNLGLMFFVWNHHKPRHKLEGPKKIIIEKLELDENQVAAYDVLVLEHQERTQEEQGKIRDFKNQLYQTLIEQNDEAKDSLIQLLADEQILIENIHYKHFLEIEALCRPEQMENFKAFVAEITSLFSQKPPPKKQ
jgi:protein CpxP